MSATSPLPSSGQALSTERVLRRLFLTLFLRGRTSRGLQKESAPKSVGTKLLLVVVIYAVAGLAALTFLRQPVFVLAVYLHAMTLVLVGLFVASSAGEVLFNKEESEILLHRPVTARALLWAKITVMVQVSVWIAGAFNICGLIAGFWKGGWMFPMAHAAAVVLEAVFCAGLVVVMYQLCLRWFGRERLDSLMTTAQVIVSVGFVIGSQLVPQLLFRSNGKLELITDAWWIWCLPPAWFAGFDDALVGTGGRGSWGLAALGLGATALVLWLAFGKLARDYETGLQVIGETVSAPRKAGRRKWLDALVARPPLSWWLRDPVARASFLLTAAYLVRDRDVKLRIYPGITPVLVMPIVFLLQGRGQDSGFGMAFAGAYLGLTPIMGLTLLQYSQQWLAADLFRVVPLPGPGPFFHGARRAVLLFLVLPVALFFCLLAWAMGGGYSRLIMLAPGIIALPIYAILPPLFGTAVPFSMPTEEAKSAGRAFGMIGVMMIAFAFSGVSLLMSHLGWFKWYLVAELALVAPLYLILRARVAALRWPAAE